MKLARYQGGGRVEIVDEPMPSCPEGGLLVRTEACGLCSGELMEWYMDAKAPHVLGHEVAGEIVESQDDRFPVGRRVFVHHHAPCLKCRRCQERRFVQCDQWRRTRLDPGGMAEYFAAAPENLTDAFLVDDFRAVDAALIEPLGCVAKSLDVAPASRIAVIGLGSMGLMHLLAIKQFPSLVGYERDPARREYARSLGIDARDPSQSQPADLVVVCPGGKEALDFAASIIEPAGTIVLFAPAPPGGEVSIDLHRLYFMDVRIVNSYSCGPPDTKLATTWLKAKTIFAEQVVSDFISIDELPAAYEKMKRGEILKAMVMF